MKKGHKIYNKYKELFYEMYSVKPVVNYGQCGKLLNELLKDYSEDTICEIIELYFLEEKIDKVFHLPSILSAYSMNKYLAKINKKVDSRLFNNSEEFNK